MKCDGREVTGWKGGEFLLSETDTLFLVQNEGTTGDSTTIEEIFEDGTISIVSNAY